MFAPHLLSASPEHRSAVPESHSVFHVRQGAGLAFAEVQFKSFHHFLKLPENFRVIALFLALKLPVVSQKSFVRGDVFWFPSLPVFVLEHLVNTFQRIGGGFHGSVVSVVKDVEFVGGQQSLKNLLVFSEDVLDHHIRLFDQSTDRLLVPTRSKARIVLEDALGLRIAKKLPEETQLADWLVRDAWVEVGGLNVLVDDIPFVPNSQKPADLPLIVLAGMQLSLFRCLGQLFIRSVVGQGIGEGVACIAGRHQASTVFVRFPITKLIAISKLSAQDKGLDKLRDGLLPIQFREVQFELSDIFIQFRIRRLAFEDLFV